MKLLILDVDGVMTDGTKTYDADHNVLSKRYCDKDFTAIKLFKILGIEVCFLSSDEFNRGMADARGIDFYCSREENGMINKEKFIPILSEKYSVQPKDMVYIGDDYVDLPMFKALSEQGGRCFIPENAFSGLLETYNGVDIRREFRNYIHGVIRCEGGCGVVNAYLHFYLQYEATSSQRKVFNEIIALW